MYSRRDLTRSTIAGLAGLVAPVIGAVRSAGAAPAPTSRSAGVRLGVKTSSFRDLPRQPDRDGVESLIQAITACGAEECELFAPQVEPIGLVGHGAGHHATMAAMTPQMMRRELRKWRIRPPVAQFASIGTRLKNAGVAVYAYNYSPDTTFSDEEIDCGFAMAKALGAEIITASTTLEQARRAAPFADKHQMVMALDGPGRAHAPDQIPSPAEFAAAANMSPFFRLNVDLGQLTSANIDAVAFIREHHKAITSVHLKDRRRDGGAVPWGEGDTPIREVLQLLKHEGWPIRAYVEYDYQGRGTSIEEVKRCVAFARLALA